MAETLGLIQSCRFGREVGFLYKLTQQRWEKRERTEILAKKGFDLGVVHSRWSCRAGVGVP